MYQKSKRNGRIAFALAAAVLICSTNARPLTAQQGIGRPLAVPAGDEWLTKFAGKTIPSNIAPFTEHSCFVASYTRMRLVDFANQTDTLLAKPVGVEIWNPTGVKYDAKRDLLYVANYKGRDILVLKFNDGKLTLKQRFTSPHFKSPEGIDVLPSGAGIAVADYDGNAVVLLDKDGKTKWVRSIKLAHGICFSHDHEEILVTSLVNREIFRLSISGEVLSTVGGKGWWKDRYLWPTSISRYANDQYLVCDAHTGQLSILDKHLQEIDTIAGNGPGAGLFNMPYHAISWGKNIVVADAFKDRIVSFNADTREIVQAFYWTDIYESRDLDQLNRRQYAAMGRQYTAYVNSQTQVNLKTYVPNLPVELAAPGYNALHGKQHTYTLCGAPPPLGSNCFYFVYPVSITANQDEHYLILICPQRPICLVIGQGVFAPVFIGENNWVLKGALVSDFQTQKLSEVARKGVLKIRRYQNGPRNLDRQNVSGSIPWG
jgi:hypothetical protein